MLVWRIGSAYPVRKGRRMNVTKLQDGELIALSRSAEVRAERAAPDLSSADLSNVIPFSRAPSARQARGIAPPADARPPSVNVLRERMRLLALAAVSLALHGGVLWALWRDPVPLVSIGEAVMSVELVVGATAPAGIAPTPGQNDVQAAAPEPQQPEPPRDAEQKATEQPQDVPVAAEEKAPEENPEQTETPPETKLAEAPKSEEEKPHEVSRDPEVSLVPPPEKKAPHPKASPKPVHNAAPAKEPRRIAAPTKEHAQKQAKAASSTAANNVGIGRSDNNSNYAGLVSAHLRRHQQYPADARSRGEQGTATVSFGLDGGGRVTSARLVRGSGIASIDQEVQAMVRRSSPFPPPPSARAVSFTVPVTFRLN
jgi:protein TonB